MNSYRNVLIGLLAVTCCILENHAVFAEKQPIQTFVLTEQLDVDWQRELLTFVLDDAAANIDPADLSLRVGSGSAIPFQFFERDGQKCIAFQSDLAPGQKRTFMLFQERREQASKVLLEQTEKTIRMRNGLIGIEVPTSEGDWRKGPITRVQLRSGKWAGAGRLDLKQPVASYDCRVTVTGPVFGEVVCKYTFSEGKAWAIRLRVIADEPVVLIDETFNLEDQSAWHLMLSPGLEPNAAAYRNCYQPGGKRVGANLVDRLQLNQTGSSFRLCHWLFWGAGQSIVSQVGFFQLPDKVKYVYDADAYKSIPVRAGMTLQRDSTGLGDKVDELFDDSLDDVDVLFAAAGFAADWAAPGEDGVRKVLPITYSDPDGLVIRCQLSGPARKWLLGASTIKDTIVPDADLADQQRYQLKYLYNPLDIVKDLTLQWKMSGDASQYPRVFIHREDIEKTRKRYPRPGGLGGPRKQAYWDFIFKPNPRNDQKIVEELMQRIDNEVRQFVQAGFPRDGGTRVPSPIIGTVHTAIRIEHILFLADTVLGRDVLSSEQRQRMFGKLAFLGYQLASPHYYDINRNHRANPNMTSLRHSTVGLMACLLDTHPKVEAWHELAWSELNRELDAWMDEEGGWIECPHYQTLINSVILFMRAAQSQGLSQHMHDPRMLKTIRYLAQISTPRNPEFGNLRHFPAVGDTPRYEVSVLFSLMAKIWREKDPAIADELQWTWIQMGRPHWVGIGGDTTLNYFCEFVTDDAEPTEPPNWGARMFPLAGVVMRSGFTTDRETYMYLIQGPTRQHYSNDRGSFVLYAKGWPLSLDWGYKGIKPGWWHNRVNVPQLGYTTAFNTQDSADYLVSQTGLWRRAVLFAKDSDPLGPNYFVLYDSVKGSQKHNWWQWFYTDRLPAVKGNAIHIVGRGDVDLEVWMSQKRLRQLPRTKDTGLLPDKPDTTDDELDFELDEPVRFPPNIDAKLHAYANVTGRLNNKGTLENLMNPATQAGIRQRGLTLPITESDPLLWIMVPRLQSQKSAKFTPLMRGTGVRIETSFGRDFVFLSDKAIEFEQGDVAFKGQVGLIQTRPDKVTLTLPAGGSIRYKQHHLESGKAISQTFE